MPRSSTESRLVAVAGLALVGIAAFTIFERYRPPRNFDEWSERTLYSSQSARELCRSLHKDCEGFLVGPHSKTKVTGDAVSWKGIRVSWFLNQFCKMKGVKRIIRYNFPMWFVRDVWVPFIVEECLDSTSSSSLLDLVEHQDPSAVSEPTVFVSYTGSHTFQRFVQMMQQLDPDDIAWIDILCVNQIAWRRDKADDIRAQFMDDTEELIGRTGCTALLIDKWDRPMDVLGKIWVLWEIFLTTEMDCTLKVILPKREKVDFVFSISPPVSILRLFWKSSTIVRAKSMGANQMITSLEQIDCQSATASRESDRKMIFGRLQQQGAEKVNRMVIDRMRDWYFGVAETYYHGIPWEVSKMGFGKSLASLYANLGQTYRAKQLLLTILPKTEEHYGPTSSHVSLLKINLAELLCDEKNFEPAKTILLEVEIDSERPELRLLKHLALENALRGLGQEDMALRELKNAWVLAKRHLRQDEPLYISCAAAVLSNLSGVEKQDLLDAIETIQSEQSYGNDNWTFTLEVFAGVEMDAPCPALGSTIPFRPILMCIPGVPDVPEPLDLHALNTMHWMEYLFLKLVEYSSRLHGEKNVKTVHAVEQLRDIFERQGRYRDVVSLLPKLEASKSSRSGELVAIAASYVRFGDFVHAEKVLCNALGEASNLVNAEDFVHEIILLHALVGLGRLQHARNKVRFFRLFLPSHIEQEMKAVLDLTEAGIEYRCGDLKGAEDLLIPLITVECEYNVRLSAKTLLGHIYLDRGDLDQASPLITEALTSPRRIEQESHLIAAFFGQSLLSCLCGDVEKARSLCVEVLPKVEFVYGSDHKYVNLTNEILRHFEISVDQQDVDFVVPRLKLLRFVHLPLDHHHIMMLMRHSKSFSGG